MSISYPFAQPIEQQLHDIKMYSFFFAEKAQMNSKKGNKKERKNISPSASEETLKLTTNSG